MIKKSTSQLFVLSTMLFSNSAYSQVGINTDKPQATLDIQSLGNSATTKSMRIINSNNTETVTITDQGRIGIGKIVPEGQLHISTLGPIGIISERASRNSTSPPYVSLRRNRSNDPNLNQAVLMNDVLGAVTFSGNTGSGYAGNLLSSNASIQATAMQNFTPTEQGSSMQFYTVPIGASVNNLRMTITDQGRVGIGTTTPSGQLHVFTTGPNGIITERASTSLNNPPYLTLRRSRSANPNMNGAVQVNDLLGVITFSGNTGNDYDGNLLSSNASIQVTAMQNFTPTEQGSSMQFNTVSVGSAISESRMTISHDGLIGIGRTPATNRLEINGEASKTTAGAFIANSDARLKKDVKLISGDEALNKLTKLEGVTYYWNDDKTGMERPKEKQIGFIAQNIQKVFPEKVTTDKQGYLQTAYGDYDAIFVESIKALHDKILKLTARLENVEQENTFLKNMKK